MIVVINLEGLLVPFGQGFRYIIPIQDFFKEGYSDGLLKVVKSGGGIFGNSKISEEDLELCDMVLNGGVPLSHFNDLVKGISFPVVRFKAVP